MFLGKPGALVEIPDPKPGVGASAERNGGTHLTLGGSSRTDYPGSTTRTFKLSWGGGVPYLSPEQYDILEQYYENDPSVGNGPWVLQPYSARGRWNYASPTYPNWTIISGGGGDQAYQFLPAKGIYRTKGVPVVAGQTWTFQARVTKNSGTAPTFTSYLDWYTATGTTPISSTAGPSGSSDSAPWAFSLTGAAPATAAFVVPRLQGTFTNVCDNAFTKVQLEQASSATTPLRGRGCPVVSMDSLTLDYNFAFQISADATFIDLN